MLLLHQLLLLFWLSCFKCVPAAPQIHGRVYKPGDVVLGNLLSLYKDEECTQSYLPGLSRLQATVFSIERINKDRKLLRNITMGYDIRDYCGSRALAMANTFDFVTNDNLLKDQPHAQFYNTKPSNACLHCSQSTKNTSAPIVAIIGPYGSRNSLQVAGLLQVVDMAAISPSATSEELSWPFYSKFYRTVPNDKYQARAMASLIEHFKWTYVAAIAVEHSYGLYGIRALERESLEKQTFCIAFTEYLPPSGYENQLSPTIDKLKRFSNIKVVLLWIGDTLAADLIQEAKRKNLRGRVWLMSDSLATKSPAFLGPVLDFFGVYLGIEPRRHRDHEFDNYLRRLTARQSLLIDNDWWDALWINEYNCSAKSLNASRMNTCPENLTITENTFQKMHDGFIPYHIDAIYAVAHALDDIYKCNRDGMSNSSHCPQTDPFVTPKDVLSYLRNVRFKGLTGQIEFDKYGDPKEASYDVIAFQRRAVDSELTYTKVTLGTWDPEKRLEINASVIKWRSHAPTADTAGDPTTVPKSVCHDVCPAGMKQTETTACCWECVECPDGTFSRFPGSRNCSNCTKFQKSNEDRSACVDLPVNALKWFDAAAIVLVAVTTVGLAFTVFVFVVFALRHQTPLVKASNRELSFFLLLEIFASFILSLVLIPEQTNVTCLISEPWRYVTHTTAVSILLLKTIRLLRAFQITAMAKWIKSFCTNYKKQLAAVCAINAVEFLLVVFWYIFDPPHMTVDVKKNEHILISCKSYKTVTGLIFQVMILCYFLLLSILCTFYAFKARTLPENFSEAKYIGFSMYILLLSWIAYLPVHYSLVGWYMVVVSCATMLVSSYGLLICMFVPKVYVILRYPEQNTSAFVRAELRTINKIGPVSFEKS